MTTSCDGLMIGAPFDGLKMLLVDIISVWASTWASIDSGRWRAIWLPSKVGVEALQASGGRLIQEGGVVADPLFEDIPHLLILALQHLLGAFDRVGVAQVLQPANDER